MVRKEFSFEDAVRKLFNHERRIAAMEKHDATQDESFKKNNLLQRVEALEAAAKKVTGNPYHLPKGPGGGEFTHGPDSAAAKSTEDKHEQPKDYHVMVSNGLRYEYETTVKGTSVHTARQAFKTKYDGSHKVKDFKVIKPRG